MAQITRKDVESYRNDKEELIAWRIAERRRQEEAFLQRVRDEAAELGRQLEPTPQWMQAIAQLRRRVIETLAERDPKEETTISASILLSDMSWRWRRKWNRLADGCRSSNALAKGLLEGGLRHCLETILPVSYAYCHRTGNTKWRLVIEFRPPKD